MPSEKQFAVCLDNTDYTAALEVRKIYQVLPDETADLRRYVRIIDESGEDYLYPSRMFLRVKFRPEANAALVKVLSFEKRKRAKNTKEPEQDRRMASASKRPKRKLRTT